MRPYANPRLHATNTTTYRLYAVVEHDATDANNLRGGHYTAKVRANYSGRVHGVVDHRWWLADDSRVSPVADENVEAPIAAYVLFYERVAI
jgi:ubiquitin C-terminal hydrolase